jgi:hypothetical protein
MVLCVKARLPIPARVVVGIDVVELKGRLAVDLDNGFSASHGVVVHVGIEKSKATGRERGHFVDFEFITHANLERTGNDRDVFALRVKMRRDAETVRHLQANREVAGGGGWVAFEYGELRARTNNGWRRSPGNSIRRERVSLMRVSLRNRGDKLARPGEKSSYCENQEHVSLHRTASVVRCAARE